MKVLIHEWVTGGGLAGRPIPPGLGREGAAMRRAAVREFAAVPGVRVVSLLDERFRDEATPGTTVAVGPGAEEATLARLARTSECTLLIAPETGGVLADRAGLVEASGGRLLGPGPEAIALAADKRRFAEHLRERGIPTPDPGATRSGPVVVKPRDGAGCVDTRLVTDPAEIAACRDLDPDAWFVQPYVEGRPLSASFLVAESGAVSLVGVADQTMEHVDGHFEYRGGTLPGPRGLGLGSPLDAVRSVPGLLGFVGVDFLLATPSGSTVVLELNPRLTTSFVGWQALFGTGVLARAWLGMLGLIPGSVAFPELPSIDGPARLAFDADGQIKEPSWNAG